MKKIFSSIFLLFLLHPFLSLAQTGCLVLNYDAYDKVFNNHETATQFYTGNGNNFVWYQGVCGPHTYIATSGPSQGPCTLNGDSKTGQIYAISGTFTAPCMLPIDDYVWLLPVFMGFIGFIFIRNKFRLA